MLSQPVRTALSCIDGSSAWRGVGQNSILSRVKTTRISVLIPEKKQRLEVVRGEQCIHQYVFPTPHDSNPACDTLTLWVHTAAGLYTLTTL